MDDLLTGFRLGDYEVQHRIGKGGMGVVYLARQVSLDRLVAIKVLPPDLCVDQEYVDRFLREARAAAHLNHPNIIQIFDAGVADNLYFFVMEYIDGKNLGQILKEQHRFEERDALYIVQQAAEGLGFAHSMSVVHRDVKPENIMVTSQRSVKIGDLGLAKWKPNELEMSLTASGTTMGTPYYISPEQIRGLKDIDGRADIYSLGMTLYHMLCGKPAFSGTSGAEIMAQHLSDKIPPIQLSNPSISQPTIDLVTAMTVKKRDQRIQDIFEVSEMISGILGNPRPDNSPSRVVRKTSSLRLNADERWNRIWTIGANILTVSIIALLLAVGGLLFWKKVQKPTKAAAHSPSTNTVMTVTQAPTPKATLPSVKPAPKPTPEPIIEKKTAPQPDPPPPPSPTPEGVVEENKAPAPPPPPAPPEIKTKTFSGLRFIQEITINSSDAPTPLNALLVGHSFRGEFKTLIKPNILGHDVESMRLFLKKLEGSDVTLELTPTYVNTERGLEIAVSRLLIPWGTAFDLPTDERKSIYSKEIGSPVTRLHKDRLNSLRIDSEETTWEYASRLHDAKWWIDGASKPGDDYATPPLPLASDSNPQALFLTSESINTPIRLNLSEDLKKWINENLSRGLYVPHPGWIITVVQGEGEARFASSIDSARSPKIVFRTPKNSVNQMTRNDSPNP